MKKQTRTVVQLMQIIKVHTHHSHLIATIRKVMLHQGISMITAPFFTDKIQLAYPLCMILAAVFHSATLVNLTDFSIKSQYKA